MMKLVDLTYYYHPEFNNPLQVVKAHETSVGFAPYLKDKLDFRFVKHMNYKGDELIDGVQYSFHKSKNKFWYIPFVTHRYIKKLKPDIVLIQGLISPLQLMALRFSLGKKCRIVVQHHAERPFHSVKKFFQKMAARYIDAYIFTAKGNAGEWIASGIIRSADQCMEIVEVSTNFTQQDKALSKASLQMTGNNNFVSIGRLSKGKDPLTVLQGFQQFLTIQPEAKLYMIHQDNQLLSSITSLLASSLDLRNAVHMIGPVDHKEISLWLSAADFFISGSHKEGSGTALVEALACGCIPVVTSIPPFQKITGNGEFGFLFEIGSVQSLFNALKRATVTDRSIFSKQIVEHFHRELSFTAIADKLYSLCVQLIPK